MERRAQHQQTKVNKTKQATRQEEIILTRLQSFKLATLASIKHCQCGDPLTIQCPSYFLIVCPLHANVRSFLRLSYKGRECGCPEGP